MTRSLENLLHDPVVAKQMDKSSKSHCYDLAEGPSVPKRKAYSDLNLRLKVI